MILYYTKDGLPAALRGPVASVMTQIRNANDDHVLVLTQVICPEDAESDQLLANHSDLLDGCEVINGDDLLQMGFDMATFNSEEARHKRTFAKLASA